MSDARATEAGRAPAAAEVAADARFLCDELLSPHQRMVRRALPGWSEELLRALDRAGSRPGAEDAAAIFNQAALLACHLGQPDDARRLCHVELRWLARAAERRGDPAEVALPLQPLINLARLDRLLGDADAALPRLGLLGALRREGALSAPPLLTISAERWAEAVAAAPGLELSLLALELTETWKTLLHARRYERVLEEVTRRHEGAADPIIACCRGEAAVAALCRLGQRHEAIALCAQLAAQRAPAARALFELRRAEALAAFGARAEALARARALGERLLPDAASTPTLDGLLLVARAARLLSALDDGAALSLARAGATAAAQIGDVPIQAELWARLLDAGAADQAEATAALRALASSGYRLPALARVAPAPAEARPVEARAPAYPELLRRLSALDPA